MMVQLTAMLAAISLGAAAQDTGAAEDTGPAPDLETLDARLADIVESHDLVGASVALADADGVYWAGGYGHADLENDVAMTPDTLMRAGSISKTFTAFLVLQAVEEGALDLDTPVRELAPDVAFTNRWEDTTPVRLVHLLEHSAGWDDIHIQEYRSFPEGTTLLDGLADNPVSRTSRWAPGRYTSYSNSGPAISGHILERTTGLEFDALARARIFDPLGMTSATFGQSEAQLAELAISYSSPDEPQPHTRIFAGPSGSLSATASDLAEFGRLLANRGQLGEESLLSPASIDRMERPGSTLAAAQGVDFGYGLHNYTSVHDGVTYRGHDGAIDGFIAQLAYRTETGDVFVLMVNSLDVDAIRAIRGELTDFLHARATQPAALTALEDVDLSIYEGFYRQVTPRNSMGAPMFAAFDFYQVTAGENGLEVRAGMDDGSDTYIAVRDGIFAEQGDSAASLAFIDNGDGLVMVQGMAGHYAQSSAFDAFLPIFLILAQVLFILVTLVYLLIWAIGRMAGAFKGSNRWRVWVWPSLGFGALITMFTAFSIAGNGTMATVTASLGTASPAAITIMAGSIGLALFAALGIWSCVRARDVKLSARIPAGLTSLVLAAFAAWLAQFGWIGIRVWDFAPVVTGV